MKKLFFTTLAVVTLAATSCSQNEELFLAGEGFPNNLTVLSATFEKGGKTRSTVELTDGDDQGKLKWTTGDAISVLLSDDSFAEFTLDEGSVDQISGIFTAELAEGKSVGDLAYYPHSDDHTKTTVYLPATYGIAEAEYAENTNAIMLGSISGVEEEQTVSFKHLAGLLCVKFGTVPAGFNQLVFTATGKKITGDFTPTTPAGGTDKEIQVAASEGGDDTVTYDFAASESARTNLNFFIPLPVGEYAGFKVELKNTVSGEVQTKETTTARTIARAQLAQMAAFENPDYTKATADDGKVTYTVYTPKGLQAVNKLITDSIADAAYNTANITLVNNITLPAPADPTTGSNWKAIGTSSNRYTGTFDGNNKKITGLVINSTEICQGLIGCLGSGGKVLDVTLEGCSVKSTQYHVGGIVGYNNSGSTGGVSGGKLIGGTVASTFTSDEITSCVGGIVGMNGKDATVTSCEVSGAVEVTSSKGSVGGVAGKSIGGTVSNCNVKTSSSAGITGNITITGATINIGGIVGDSEGNVEKCNVTASSSANITITAGKYTVGGIVGANAAGSITSCTLKKEGSGTIGITAPTGMIGGIVGGCTNIITDCSVLNSGSGSISITTSGVNSGGIAGQSSGKLLGCKVINSKTKEDKVDQTGITITATNNSAGGITGVNMPAGIASGCVAIGCTVSGKYWVGGIVGRVNQSTLAACHAKEVSVSMTQNTESPNTVGGIVGANNQNVTGCYAYETSITISGSAVTDATTANVVGANTLNGSTGTVTDCYYVVKGGSTLAGYDDSSSPATGDWSDIAGAMNDELGASATYTWDTEGKIDGDTLIK